MSSATVEGKEAKQGRVRQHRLHGSAAVESRVGELGSMHRQWARWLPHWSYSCGLRIAECLLAEWLVGVPLVDYCWCATD